MPGGGRADAHVDTGAVIYTSNGAQHQGITLAHNSVGADRRGIAECPRTRSRIGPQSGVVKPSAVAAVERGSGKIAGPCVETARGVGQQCVSTVPGVSAALAGGTRRTRAAVVLERL